MRRACRVFQVDEEMGAAQTGEVGVVLDAGEARVARPSGSDERGCRGCPSAEEEQAACRHGCRAARTWACWRPRRLHAAKEPARRVCRAEELLEPGQRRGWQTAHRVSGSRFRCRNPRLLQCLTAWDESKEPRRWGERTLPQLLPASWLIQKEWTAARRHSLISTASSAVSRHHRAEKRRVRFSAAGPGPSGVATDVEVLCPEWRARLRATFPGVPLRMGSTTGAPPAGAGSRSSATRSALPARTVSTRAATRRELLGDGSLRCEFPKVALYAAASA